MLVYIWYPMWGTNKNYHNGGFSKSIAYVGLYWGTPTLEIIVYLGLYWGTPNLEIMVHLGVYWGTPNFETYHGVP